MYSSTLTLNLLWSVETGRLHGRLDQLVERARLNKMLLGFLRRINYDGELRWIEEERYSNYIDAVVMVAEALKGLDYALFKLQKPIEHVSVDIDILVRREHIPRAIDKLRGLGFRIGVKEPYTVTMVKNSVIVDLYTNPSFAWVVYLDGERLLGEIESVKLYSSKHGSIEVNALSRDAETISILAHAIYKEHIYLLSDYFVSKYWINPRVIELADELRVLDAIRVSQALNKLIENGLVEAPVRLSYPFIAGILLRKFTQDSDFRATSLNILRLLSQRRTIELLLWRLRRTTY